MKDLDPILDASNYVSSDEVVEIGDAFEESDGLAWRFNPQFRADLLAWRDRCVAEAEKAARTDQIRQDYGYFAGVGFGQAYYDEIMEWRDEAIQELTPTQPTPSPPGQDDN